MFLNILYSKEILNSNLEPASEHSSKLHHGILRSLKVIDYLNNFLHHILVVLLLCSQY